MGLIDQVSLPNQFNFCYPSMEKLFVLNQPACLLATQVLKLQEAKHSLWPIQVLYVPSYTACSLSPTVITCKLYCGGDLYAVMQ